MGEGWKTQRIFGEEMFEVAVSRVISECLDRKAENSYSHQCTITLPRNALLQVSDRTLLVNCPLA